VSTYSKNRIKNAGRVLRRFESSTPDEVLEAIGVIDEWRAGHAKPLRRVNAGLRHYVRKAGVEQPEVTQRLKRFATIVDKLRRQSAMALSRMEDIGGVRVIVPTQDQVDAIVRDLQSQPRWKIRRTREYVEGRDPGPKSDGYRAIHVIVVKDGCYIEVQLRTPRQDAWAQSVEQDTRRLGQGLKFGAGPDDLREYYVMVSELLAMRERHEEPSSAFMEQLASKFAATRGYFPDEESR
jgi:ppGpp synthetase/RelA/SpoT-type nucleotidyltranferase